MEPKEQEDPKVEQILYRIHGKPGTDLKLGERAVLLNGIFGAWTWEETNSP